MRIHTDGQETVSQCTGSLVFNGLHDVFAGQIFVLFENSSQLRIGTGSQNRVESRLVRTPLSFAWKTRNIFFFFFIFMGKWAIIEWFNQNQTVNTPASIKDWASATAASRSTSTSSSRLAWNDTFYFQDSPPYYLKWIIVSFIYLILLKIFFYALVYNLLIRLTCVRRIINSLEFI